MESVSRLSVVKDILAKPPPMSMWLLRGVTSYERYTTRSEHDKLVALQPKLGRAEATHAALIPIKKHLLGGISLKMKGELSSKLDQAI